MPAQCQYFEPVAIHIIGEVTQGALIEVWQNLQLDWTVKELVWTIKEEPGAGRSYSSQIVFHASC